MFITAILLFLTVILLTYICDNKLEKVIHYSSEICEIQTGNGTFHMFHNMNNFMFGWCLIIAVGHEFHSQHHSSASNISYN